MLLSLNFFVIQSLATSPATKFRTLLAQVWRNLLKKIKSCLRLLGVPLIRSLFPVVLWNAVMMEAVPKVSPFPQQSVTLMFLQFLKRNAFVHQAPGRLGSTKFTGRFLMPISRFSQASHQQQVETMRCQRCPLSIPRSQVRFSVLLILFLTILKRERPDPRDG